jgi:DNA-binding transcriptional LysR family regulator
MFDWNDLKYFLAVARSGSTLAAAKVLSVNQSTVHRRLDELEKRLGHQLAVRQQSGYKLTELGQDLVTYAERVEEAVQSLERHLVASDVNLAGSIRITCPEAIGVRLLLQFCADSQQHCGSRALTFGSSSHDTSLCAANAAGATDVSNRGSLAIHTDRPLVLYIDRLRNGPEYALGNASVASSRASKT